MYLTKGESEMAEYFNDIDVIPMCADGVQSVCVGKRNDTYVSVIKMDDGICYPSIILNDGVSVGIVKDNDIDRIQSEYPNINNGTSTFLITETRFLRLIMRDNEMYNKPSILDIVK